MNMTSILTQEDGVLNYEQAPAFRMNSELELYAAVVNSALEDKYYEGSSTRVSRIVELINQVPAEFVAKLAVYARTQMHMRSVPLLLLVELARIHKGDDLVSRAVAKTVVRADEITQLLMCYQWRNPSTGFKKLGRLSRGIQNGLKESFKHFDEYQFAKYNRESQQVTLRDALYLVHPKAETALQQALFNKISRCELSTPYTWETELSAIGQKSFATAEEKKAAIRETWEQLIMSGKIGYMALLRNLRNILHAGVCDRCVARVCDIISDPAEVARSRQFPFRFLSAYRELWGIRSPHIFSVLMALEAAAQASASNIAGFGADTNVLFACDVSGSMTMPISRNSQIQNYDIGLMLAMLLQNRCKNVITGIFGTAWKVVNVPKTGILSGTMSLHKRGNEVGFSTNGYLVVDYLLEKGISMDRVMMFTDCQLWDSTSQGRQLEKSWSEYRKLYPKAKLYLFDLSGYGNTPVRVCANGVNLIAGWSDKVFDILQALEKGEDAVLEIYMTDL